MRYLLSIAFVLTSLWLGAQPRLVDGIVAVVGRNIVLKSDIEQQYENYKTAGHA
ncbi:MAG: hypothetical protein U5L96_08535 [Owenweeksia sp.]|nr:hypothetical protein [Owenweeksia sp.]